MTHFQKVIKYFAIAFAIFLTVTIVSGVSTAAIAIFGVTGIISNINESKDVIDYSNEFHDIKSLDIDLAVAELNIVTSNEFSVEATGVSNKFICENDNDTLKIKDNARVNNFWSFIPGNKNTKITVCLPSDFIAELVTIKAGVGNICIESLYGEEMDFELGVGKFVCDNLLSNKINISGGVGEIDIKKAKSKDIVLDSGIGKVSINLIGNKDDYKIITESGIGEIRIDGQKYSDGTVKNDKVNSNTLEVHSGIGEANINFEN